MQFIFTAFVFSFHLLSSQKSFKGRLFHMSVSKKHCAVYSGQQFQFAFCMCTWIMDAKYAIDKNSKQKMVKVAGLCADRHSTETTGPRHIQNYRTARLWVSMLFRFYFLLQAELHTSVGTRSHISSTTLETVESASDWSIIPLTDRYSCFKAKAEHGCSNN